MKTVPIAVASRSETVKLFGRHSAQTAAAAARGTRVGVVRLPLRLDSSEPDRLYRLIGRRDRPRVDDVLREAEAGDIEAAMLVDQCVGLLLPADLRAAWAPLTEPLPVPHSGTRSFAAQAVPA